ncbi:MAG: S41 family peptidase [Planctomycetia bacterium]
MLWTLLLTLTLTIDDAAPAAVEPPSATRSPAQLDPSALGPEIRRRSLARLGALGGAAVPLDPEWAAPPETPSTPVVWVLIVGLEHYADPKIPGRPHAVSDAVRLYETLTSPEIGGVDPKRAWLLVDGETAGPAQPATRSRFEDALRTIAARGGPNDVVLLWLAAAALPDDDAFRWLFHDADPARLDVGALHTADLEKQLDAVPCRWVLSLLDASFDQAATALGLQRLVDDADWSHRFNGLTKPGRPGRLAIAAARGKTPPNETAGRGQGRLAAAVLAGLGGAADRDPTDATVGDGWVTAAELWAHLERTLGGPEVPADERPLLAGGKRLPRTPLARHLPAWPPVRDRVQRIADLHRQGRLPEPFRTEAVRLLSRMPAQQAEVRLRQGYERLADGAIELSALRPMRERTAREMALPAAEAQQFAEAVLKAYDRIDANYVREGRGPRALAAGLGGLVVVAEETPPGALKRWVDAGLPADRKSLGRAVAETRRALGRRDDLPGHEALDVVLGGMFEALDPYSRYIDAAAYREFKKTTEGQFAGVGIQVRANADDGTIEVVTPLVGSPAALGGVWAGDRIVAIDGRPLQRLDMEEAVRLLAGKRGESVTLDLKRAGSPDPVRVVLQRAVVKVETVLGVERRPDGGWNHYLDRDAGIAYIRLTNFGSDTGDDLRAALRDLRRTGLTSLALDLRFNPGGLLAAAVDVADLFLDAGAIVTVRGRAGRPEEFRAARFGTLSPFPMVVLVNQGSASASEIVAAALADHERAAVVGQRSFGKGSVQTIFPLEQGACALKLTTAMFYRPSGPTLHRFPESTPDEPWGVRPTDGLEVALNRAEVVKTYEHLRRREVLHRPDEPPPSDAGFIDRQLETAVEYLRSRKK